MKIIDVRLSDFCIRCFFVSSSKVLSVRQISSTISN